jgi:hypothetical protein
MRNIVDARNGGGGQRSIHPKSRHLNRCIDTIGSNRSNNRLVGSGSASWRRLGNTRTPQEAGLEPVKYPGYARRRFLYSRPPLTPSNPSGARDATQSGSLVVAYARAACSNGVYF